jgi:isopentenyl diphosphate isomerase/L-lactate dehydrogenase-like FMN-dependent dehydrogenase
MGRTLIHRRRLIEFLAASPLLAASDVMAQVERLPDPAVWGPRTLDRLIGSPSDAIDVFDFELVAHKKVPPAHFGYMVSGVDDEVTLRANREGFQKFQLLPRRLVDVGKVDTRMELFGETWKSPIVVMPTGSNRAFHEDGELAVARAAKAGDHLEMLSTVATTSIEDAIAARGRSVWFQLYPTDKWEVAEALARRADKAGAGAVVVTVDVIARQNWETLYRMIPTDTRNCSTCHLRTMKSFVERKPNFDGINMAGVQTTSHSTLTWSFLKRLRDSVKTKLLVKGLVTGVDARLALENGLDGIVVSNHGGRAEDLGRSTIDALPEIMDVVGNRIPVIVDSGFRRGTDIVKALAMGARAVGIGRPYLWGLGAFGQSGVERVLAILQGELRSVMMQMGAPSLKDLVPEMVRRVPS